MTEKPTLIQRVIEFLFSIGLPPIRIAQAAIFLVLVAALIYWGFREPTVAERSADADAETITVVEKPKETATFESEFSVDQQINELLFFDGANNGYVLLASEMENRNSKIESLRQSGDLTQQQTIKLDSIQLADHLLLVERMIDDGIDYGQEEATFKQFSTSLLESSDEELRASAGFALTMVAAKKFAKTASEDNFKSAIDAVKIHESAFNSDPKRCDALLSVFVIAKTRNSDNTYADECFKTLGDIFTSSELPQVQTMGEDLGVFVLFSKFKLATLENRIRYKDRDALNDLDGALRVLESHPEVKLKSWRVLMRCYEASLSTGRLQDTETAGNILRDLVNKLPNSDTRKPELLNLLERQKARTSAIGRAFDLSGTTAQGDRISISSGEFTVLIFANRNALSRNLLNGVLKTNLDSGRRFRQVIAFADEFTERDKLSFGNIPSGIFVAGDETSQKYLAAFPVDFFPYLILVDREGNLISANLSLIQAANRIAAIETKERKEKRQLLNAQ